MVNILLPSMGSSAFFADAFFPKPMIEINGRTMLERIVENFSTVPDGRLIFIYRGSECRKFHLDDSVRLLTESQAEVIMLEEDTAGALCTSLLAIDYIDGEAPLVIANADQIIDVDYAEVLKHFEDEQADGGVISFGNIHPRWSYLRAEQGVITEVAEKRPLSKHAIAGFYYYRHGSDFIQAAEQAILKQESVNGTYYLSAALNEMNLMGRRLVYYEVPSSAYHSFYSPAKISEYERGISHASR